MDLPRGREGRNPLPTLLYHIVPEGNVSVPNGATLRAVLTFLLSDRSKAQNVYHIKHTTGSAQEDSDVLDACGEWAVAMMTPLVAKVHEDVSLSAVEVFERVAGLWEPIGVDHPTFVGTGTGDMCPSGIAVLVHFNKLRTGYTDKKYLAGFAEADIAGDLWSVGLDTAAAAYAALVIQDFTATNSVKLTPIHFNSTLEVVKEYTGYQVATLVSYQRRRKPGVGLT